jgi:hypothetical protein
MPNFFGTEGDRKTSYPEILGGDIEKQIRAIRDHLYTLGGGSVRVR